MAKAPLICKKLSAGSSAEAIGKELDRRAHTYANEVDPSRTHLNLDYVRQQDGRMVPVPHAEAAAAGYEHLEDAIERRIGELKTKRKIRADAVRAEGMVISTEGALDDNEALAFLHEAIDWMGERYGWENVLAASIHMDEAVAHAQLWIAPVIHDETTGYDRLSAKELFTPNRVDKKTKKVLAEGTLGRLQREFYEQVAAGYGFERPFTSEQRFANGIEYKSQAAFKAAEQAKQENQRLERLRREQEESQWRARKELEQQRRAAEAERAARERNRVLVAERDEARKREQAARERNRELAADRNEAERRGVAAGRDRGRAEGRVQRLDRRLEGLKKAFRSAVKAIRRHFGQVWECTLSQMEKAQEVVPEDPWVLMDTIEPRRPSWETSPVRDRGISR